MMGKRILPASGRSDGNKLERINPRTDTSAAVCRVSASLHMPPRMMLPRILTSRRAEVRTPSGFSARLTITPVSMRPLPHTPWMSAPTVLMTTPRSGTTSITLPGSPARSCRLVSPVSSNTCPPPAAITLPSLGVRTVFGNSPVPTATSALAGRVSPTLQRSRRSAAGMESRSAPATSMSTCSRAQAASATTSVGPTFWLRRAVTRPATGRRRSRVMVVRGRM